MNFGKIIIVAYVSSVAGIIVQATIQKSNPNLSQHLGKKYCETASIGEKTYKRCFEVKEIELEKP